MQAEYYVTMAETSMGTAMAAISAVVLVLAIVSIWLLARVRHLSRSHARLVAGSQGESLEAVLHDHMGRVARALARSEEAAAACAGLERRMEKCVQRVGSVRFDAFDDVGGQFSFALALLDSASDGVMLTSIYGRKESRLYAKAIKAGQSKAPLSVEEVEALRRAGCSVGSKALQSA